MKCQNCGNYEATFHYKSNINGTITEQHLCQACAQGAEGSVFAKSLAENGQMFKTGLFGDSIFGGNFHPALAQFFEMPTLMDGFFGAPVEHTAAPPTEQSAARIPADAGADVKKRRELNRLRNEMRAAVKSESFERAAELRDQIYRMEKE